MVVTVPQLSIMSGISIYQLKEWLSWSMSRLLTMDFIFIFSFHFIFFFFSFLFLEQLGLGFISYAVT